MRQYEKLRFFGHVTSENLVRWDAVGFELGHELEGVIGCPNHSPVENRDPLTVILSQKLRIVSLIEGNVPRMYLCSFLGIPHLSFILCPELLSFYTLLRAASLKMVASSVPQIH